MDDDMENENGVELEEEDDDDCGPQKGKPKVAFKPHMDVYKDQFIVVRPHEKIYPIWLGLTLFDVDKNKGSPNYLKVLVNYWAPVAKGNISIVQR